MDYDEVLKVATTAARNGSAVLSHYAGKAEVNFKEGSTQNLVTQADVEAEAAIVDVIRKHYPSHSILGEEGGGDVDLQAEHLWVIDPLDGTTNYVHRIPQYCSAVAYASRGVVQVGVVLDPCRKELFHAVRGSGAFLNGEPISVTKTNAFTEAVVATGFYYDRGEMMRQTLASIERLFEHNVRGVRRLGAAALDLCWVACGRWEGFFEYQLSPWDYAASSVIVEEAGGRCGDRVGNPLKIESGNVIAANAHLFDEICSVVSWRAQ